MTPQTTNYPGSQVVLAHESMVAFESVLLRYDHDYEQPATAHELFLVETLAQAHWRIARFRRLETAALNLVLGEADLEAPDTKLALALIAKDGQPTANIERYAAAAERTYHRAQRELAQAQKSRRSQKTEQSQIDPIPAEPDPPTVPPVIMVAGSRAFDQSTQSLTPKFASRPTNRNSSRYPPQSNRKRTKFTKRSQNSSR